MQKTRIDGFIHRPYMRQKLDSGTDVQGVQGVQPDLPEGRSRQQTANRWRIALRPNRRHADAPVAASTNLGNT